MTSGEHDAARVRIPPPLVFLSAVILGELVGRFVFPLPLSLALEPRIGIAVTLGVLGVVPMGIAIGLFARTHQDPAPWKTTPEIISTGIYAWTRNPMYVGMGLIQTSLGVALANGWILALVPAVLFVVYMAAIRHEEAYLETKFGQAYVDYKGSVRRWI